MGNKKPMVDPVRRHIASVLKAIDEDQAWQQAEITKLEAAGHRIVDGGQTGSYQDGEAPWQSTDWRTGEVLAQGKGDVDSFMNAWQDNWIHVDRIADRSPYQDTVRTIEQSAELSASLAKSLTEWVQDHEEEAREWLAEQSTMEKVAELLALGASYGTGITVMPDEKACWEVGWMRGRHGGWFGFAADNLGEAAEEAIKRLPEVAREEGWSRKQS